MGPLLTFTVHSALLAARDAGATEVVCSLDLGRTEVLVQITRDGWTHAGVTYPFLETCRDRTIYAVIDGELEPVSRYRESLIKLVPTEWGPPTFEIDGIKMLPTAKVSPFADAERKVALIAPRGKVILDTCGGLGYFASWCLAGHATRVLSYEKNPDVLWLRSHNPWSPVPNAVLSVTCGDITELIAAVPTASVDAILHDPPRFGIAGELYSQTFYGELARVIRPRGRLFHYTGSPNALTSGRDVPGEVTRRLQKAGFRAQREGDGLLAVR